jgi:hypothetical protein
VKRRCIVLSLTFLLPAIGSAQTDAPQEFSYTISAAQEWIDSGTDLKAGDNVSLTAESKSGTSGNCTPAGSGSGEKLPVSGAPAGALIARTSQSATPVLVGATRELHAENDGHLFLGINGQSDCVFVVKAEITHAQNTLDRPAERPKMKDQLSSAAKVWLQGQLGKPATNNGSDAANAVSSSGANSTPAAASGLKIPTLVLDSGLRKNLDGLPRRVHDHLGNPGDMVNFVIIASEDRAKAALDAADWHLADVDSKEAGLKAIMNTYQKKDYLEMPMSHLYLFDRMQDYGYEQAQAFSVVASRHHFRMWKAPFTYSDEMVFVGAGTHDIGFEKDVRSGHLTHKIDPEVDLERENIAQSLDKSGKVKSMTYYVPPNPVQDAKNASGGGYHSDGRLLVVFLK